MNSTAMNPVHAIVIAFSLTGIMLPALGDAPVLKWNDGSGTNIWNATETNWIDSSDAAVIWQPGAKALFEGTGGTVKLKEDLSATELTFIGSGYHLSGINILSLEGAISASSTTENTIATALYSTAGIDKTGEGTINLTSPSLTLYAPLTVSQGTLALQGTAIPGKVSVAASAVLAALPAATNGLMGFYYSVTNTSADFASLKAMEAHFSRHTPNLAASSSLAGPTFDFGDAGQYLPLPYGAGGSRTEFFEVLWRGTITVPQSTSYTFLVRHDDGFLLAIDGKMVMNRLVNNLTEETIYLTAGKHDMVLGLYQDTGPCKMKIEVKAIADSTYSVLPNSWLAPYTSVGSLSGDGTISLPDSAASLNIAQRPDFASTFSGEIVTSPGSLFTKSGWGNLALTAVNASSNAIAGDVAVMGGTLKLRAAERIGDTSTVTVGGESVLNFAADETIGALSGSGTVILGGSANVFVAAFADDADSGLSTSKTYTHLLDFPDNGNPATINDVPFISAGMNGSTNGYAWSTVNPPPNSWNDAPNDSTRTGVDRLLWDFLYHSPDFTLTLSGLTPGQSYETRLYFRSFGEVNPNAPRKLNFSFSAGAVFVGSLEYKPDTSARSSIVCRYIADSSGTLTLRVIAHDNGHTCHVYALSNEETEEQNFVQLEPTTAPAVVAFTGDAESGLSDLKTYTHKLDFPNNGKPATVNRVIFTSAGMNGSADGYSWNTTGNLPTGIWNEPIGTGIAKLLQDFYYGSTDFTLNLAGLHPGQSYEARLYFRSFGNPVPDSPRDVTITFAAGATALGSINHDLDSMAQSMVRCSYTADATGTVSIRVVSINSGSSCHLYGVTNEERYKPTTLTLNPPAGTTPYHTGAILGNGAIVKKGAGTQSLACANRLTTPLDVQAGTLALAPGSSVDAGVTIAAGATLAVPNGNVRIGGLEGAGTFRLAGVSPYPLTGMVSIHYFTNDLTTGISTSKVYTHLMDFGTRSAPATVINGVTFNNVTSQSGTFNGYGWNNFPPNPYGGNTPTGEHGVPDGSGIYELLYDMDYGHAWPTPATMQLTGLTPGKNYEVHLFNRTWGWGGSRTQTVTFDPDGAGPIAEVITFNPDMMEPNFVAYRYTAVSSVMEITILSALGNQTLHLYGLTNEEGDAPVEVEIAENSVFAGLVAGNGGWIKSGAGTLTLTGVGDASGAITITAGALGIAEGGTATTGKISVEAGATLFGNGSIGGGITVASNAVIYAGTPSACGTMQINGGLRLEPGALPRWRYESGASDITTVNGLLVFPSSGVLRVESLTEGLKPQAKATVFSSTQPINGPEDLSGWAVEGINNSSLTYSSDRTKIYFMRPSGTLFMIR